jgi:hypothetical protein
MVVGSISRLEMTRNLDKRVLYCLLSIRMAYNNALIEDFLRSLLEEMFLFGLVSLLGWLDGIGEDSSLSLRDFLKRDK